jgi:hypothetical protein
MDTILPRHRLRENATTEDMCSWLHYVNGHQGWSYNHEADTFTFTSTELCAAFENEWRGIRVSSRAIPLDEAVQLIEWVIANEVLPGPFYYSHFEFSTLASLLDGIRDLVAKDHISENRWCFQFGNAEKAALYKIFWG